MHFGQLVRGLHLFVFALASIYNSAAVAAAPAKSSDEKRGERIFHGKEVLKGSLSGHTDKLAPQMSRCVNCHTHAKPANKGIKFAPVLTPAWLLEKQARRGGPAYAYNRDSFCKTLRTGIDPEYVVLGRTMPRFELDDAQCNALWTYLTTMKKP